MATTQPSALLRGDGVGRDNEACQEVSRGMAGACQEKTGASRRGAGGTYLEGGRVQEGTVEASATAGM